MKKGQFKKDMENQANELDGIVMTMEDASKNLKEIEAKLAERFGLTGNFQQIRNQLLSMDLDEDELVQDWIDAYSWYVSYIGVDTGYLKFLLNKSSRGLWYTTGHNQGHTDIYCSHPKKQATKVCSTSDRDDCLFPYPDNEKQKYNAKLIASVQHVLPALLEAFDELEKVKLELMSYDDDMWYEGNVHDVVQGVVKERNAYKKQCTSN